MEKDLTKERKKKIAKANKLRPFLGADMCACCPLARCEGPCRKVHTNEAGEVQCFELYRIDSALINIKDKKHKKRIIKTDIQEHSVEKSRRREKISERKNRKSN